MSPRTETLEFELEPADLRRLSDLCGPFDDNLKHIERRLGVEITHRGHHFRLIGSSLTVSAVQNILRDLYVETATVKGQTAYRTATGSPRYSAGQSAGAGQR